MSSPQSAATHYWLAVGAVAMLLLLRIGLGAWLHGHGAFLLFIPAILLAAGAGGLGPGLVATALSLISGIFVGGVENLTRPEIVEAAIFAAVGIGISWFGEQLCRTRLHDQNTADNLRAREAHLRSVLDTVPDATIVICEKGIIQSFNAAAERLFGHREAEVVGKNVSMLGTGRWRPDAFGLPTVLMVNQRTKRLMDHANAAGVTTVLEKPLLGGVLFEAIRSALDGDAL